MTKTLHYVFDPLCGWCYGASSALADLAASPAVVLNLQPSGLFTDEGARPMDDAFAAYAWSNDQRIERLTGQPFSLRYRTDVLADRRQMFDSGPATVALTAVWLTEPAREAQALKAFQQARYVDGRNITHRDTLVDLLQSLDLTDAAQRLTQADDALLAATRSRTAQAQALMQRVGARGVPTFVLESNGRPQVVPPGAIYTDPQAFLDRIAAA